MAQIDGLPSLSDVIRTHELSAKKSLGQNFLLDLNLTAKIARQAGDLSGCDVLEVGPGPGGLTRGLLAEGARRVLAIEKDPRCLPALAEISKLYPGQLQVIQGDALEVNVLEHLTPPIRVAANLPYNVGTELLVRWLTPKEWPPFWQSLTLMFQKEVAERIASGPGNKTYGILSVLLQAFYDITYHITVPAEAFRPPPKVESGVLRLIRNDRTELPCSAKFFKSVVKTSFGMRRKTLRNSLKTLLNERELPDEFQTRRPEELSVDEFLRLCVWLES